MSVIFRFISSTLKRIGFEFSSFHTKWLSVNKVYIQNITLNGYNLEIKANSNILHYSILESISKFKLIGFIEITELVLKSNSICDKPLTIDSTQITFSLNRRVCLFEVNMRMKLPLFIQIERNRNNYAFYIKSNNIVWNDFILLFNKYLYSKLLQNMFSTNSFSMLTYLKIPYKYSNISPIFYAKVSYDKNFCMFRDFESYQTKIIIDKTYLLNIIYHKYPNTNSYLPLKKIPSILQETIISTEDPLFKSHKGVCPEFVSLAIEENISKKKLARGASTITMQLVKNLFLNNMKTFSRKLEEIIISLLLENVFYISKNDILELYLNIIEFGPNIYGIENGSLFYFSKHCSGLNIMEIIILTYIIPRPNSFYNIMLTNPEELNLNLLLHVQKYTNILINKNIISIEDLIRFGIRDVSFSRRFNNYHFRINPEDYKNMQIINALHPSIRQEVRNLIEIINSKLTVSKMILTSGIRTFEEQEQLSKKSSNITDAKAGQSYHNYGLAFDFCLSISGVNVWDAMADYDNDGIADWAIVVRTFKDAGYYWGGDLENLYDASHFEKRFNYSCQELYKKHIDGDMSNGYVVL